jgi:aryl-alcohol dehydrogenase-like predicted oxidoreductase
MAKIKSTDLDVFPLCLGGNVFGWTSDEKQSFAVLDAYFAAGGNFVDTADVYSAWAPGNAGGESETIIGRWMKERQNRDKIIVATKVGKHPHLSGLSAKTIRTAAEQSLDRLQVDSIDLYYAHADDEQTPLEETLGAFGSLVREGKVRYIAASNYSAQRLAEALQTSDEAGLPRYVALQPHYNLVEREGYEGELAGVVAREGLSSVPYYALASGFLTGKYRASSKVNSPRAEKAFTYLNERGTKVLNALDLVAAAHQTSVTSVALAWLAAQPTVISPIASARTVEQIPDLIAGATLKLSEEDLRKLGEASGETGENSESRIQNPESKSQEPESKI